MEMQQRTKKTICLPGVFESKALQLASSPGMRGRTSSLTEGAEEESSWQTLREGKAALLSSEKRDGRRRSLAGISSLLRSQHQLFAKRRKTTGDQ
jgi:hypothetical protein